MARKEGKEEQANRILSAQLPKSIQEWAGADPRQKSTKQAELRSMFTEENKRVETALVIQDLVAKKLSKEVIPGLLAEFRMELAASLENHYRRIESLLLRHPGTLQIPDGEPNANHGAAPMVKGPDVAAMIDVLLAQRQFDEQDPNDALGELVPASGGMRGPSTLAMRPTPRAMAMMESNPS